MIESRYYIAEALTCATGYLKNNINLRVKSTILLLLLLLVVSCSTKPTFDHQSLPTNYSPENRLLFLTAIKNWQISGKIAFIEGKEKKSATLFWQNNPKSQSEQLNLTTYLGINVLDVSFNGDIYTIRVEDKIYRHSDIDYILQSLSGYYLPSQALKQWIKALPFNSDDDIVYHKDTQLPVSINSYYDNKVWKILYSEYTRVNGIPLPKRLTIKQNNLTIKLIINQWVL
ncbi:lipoprotein insertase outer membrane protein LolB [Thalassotalea piscium]|uniref:Outer-membrane lipoprotein LolB n=1 Tax=Thalassotalea piscium TaxID=1230533 RepID=A0A7X0NIL3_9GAMM|nr:lipoprotein insertase outer membrane protein LolB [Thalassotalea piscium]MBB6544137.1 outer membrane lipoprotein LolB [Thalassotalea piscium]